MELSENEHIFPNAPSRITKKDLDAILFHAVQHQASDVTLQSSEPIVGEIFGHLYPLTQRALLHSEICELLNSIYGANGTTQLASGVDLDTHYEIKPSRFERIRFRVNGTACMINGGDGIQLTLRSIPIDPPKIKDLDLEPMILENYSPEQGVVVVTGSTGSGKSTLLASLIRSIAEDPGSHRKILTYEAPIEFVYDNIQSSTTLISQSEIPKHLPSFAAGVRNALRRKPRLILVGEARDEQTIASVIDAALTGHPVYTTLHSNGVADCVRRMISTFPAEERTGRALDILEIMRLVVWQKLVPSLDGKRVPLREILVFNDEIRDMLIDCPVEMITAKTRECLKKYGQPIEVDAKKKWKAGLIDERTYNFISRSSASLD